MGGGNSKIPEIPKKDLHMLLQKTSITAKEIKQWYRIYMKECPSGKLTKDQFGKIYSELNGQSDNNDPHRQRLHEHIFRTYDQDNSGHIDFAEFMQAINVTRSSNAAEKLRLVFRLYDIDQNGRIEEQEMVEVMKEMSKSESDPQPEEVHSRIAARARKVFNRVDTNGDGYITIDELVTICLREPEVCQLVLSRNKLRSVKH